MTWVPDDAVIETTLVERISHFTGLETHGPVELRRRIRTSGGQNMIAMMMNVLYHFPVTIINISM